MAVPHPRDSNLLLPENRRPTAISPTCIHEQQDQQDFVVSQHLIDQFKKLITPLAHLAWLLESKLAADVKVFADCTPCNHF